MDDEGTEAPDRVAWRGPSRLRPVWRWVLWWAGLAFLVPVVVLLLRPSSEVPVLKVGAVIAPAWALGFLIYGGADLLVCELLLVA